MNKRSYRECVAEDNFFNIVDDVEDEYHTFQPLIIVPDSRKSTKWKDVVNASIPFSNDNCVDLKGVTGDMKLYEGSPTSLRVIRHRCLIFNLITIKLFQMLYHVRTILERMVYPFARRFLSNRDPKRQISKAPYNPAIPYHVEAERKAKPEFLSYNEYLNFCDQSAAHPKKEAVNGCKKKWSFHILPYAHKIVIFTDGMHVFGNVIGDSLNLFRPGNVNKENRSASASVLQYERSNGRFLGGFLFSHYPPSDKAYQ